MHKFDISSYKRQNSTKKKHPDKNGGVQRSRLRWSDLLNTEISFGAGGLSDKNKEQFYLEFSTLLNSGVDIGTAFDLILVERKNKKQFSIYEGIQKDLISGESLSNAMSNSEKFSNYEIQSVRIGEETGKIGVILHELAVFYKGKISQQRKIISALTYPIVVCCTSLGAVFFMLKFVVPMFSDVFLNFGGELPWITAFIVKISDIIDQMIGWVIVILLMLVLITHLSRRKEWFRKGISLIALRIPFVGDIVRKTQLAQFANIMRLLISTNVPLLQSIQLVRQMSNFFPIEESLKATEIYIENGEALYQCLSRFSIYPQKMIQLIKVGEEVNRLEFFFEKIAEQYTGDVEYSTSTLSTVLEPLIIIFLGLVVGLILIAMYLPMFQISNSF